jgi:hypothetical protein
MASKSSNGPCQRSTGGPTAYDMTSARASSQARTCRTRASIGSLARPTAITPLHRSRWPPPPQQTLWAAIACSIQSSMTSSKPSWCVRRTASGAPHARHAPRCLFFRTRFLIILVSFLEMAGAYGIRPRA